MKIYFNEELAVLEMSEIVQSLSEQDLLKADFIKLGKLREANTINELIRQIKGNNIYFYNYAYLKLSLLEFRKLDNTLKKNDIQLIFLNETPSFYTILCKVMDVEYQCVSERIIQSIEKSKKNGTVIGRPRIGTEKRKQIIYFYKEKQMSMRSIAAKCEVSLGTVHKYVTEVKEE